jgi:hypothetical protein
MSPQPCVSVNLKKPSVLAFWSRGFLKRTNVDAGLLAKTKRALLSMKEARLRCFCGLVDRLMVSLGRLNVELARLCVDLTSDARHGLRYVREKSVRAERKRI